MPKRRILLAALLAALLTLIAIVAAALGLGRPASPQPLQPTFGPVVGDNPLVEQRELLFMSNRDGDWDIYAMRLADRSLTRLTDNDADDGFASYSADGGAISFLSNRGGPLDAYLMNADGSDQRPLANDLATILAVVTSGRLNWDDAALDQTNAAFTSLRDLNLEIYTRDASGQHNLTRHGAVDWYPAWSADASQIAFGSDRDGNQEIYIMNADGTNLRRLTDAPGDDLYPMWWGNTVYFMSDRDVPFARGQIGLYRVNLDDTSPRIERVESSEQIPFLDKQSWPDNSTMLYAMQSDGQWDIFAADGVGRHSANLTANSADDLFPVWRPAG